MSLNFANLSFKLFLCFIFLLPWSGCAKAQLNITTHEGTPREEQGKQQLEQIVDRYDVSPWIFTKDIVIQSFEIPHSHPVLTLNTKYLDDDEMQLSTFLHEQIHWHVADREEAEAAAIAEFRKMYPEVPVRGGQGARDEYSSYLHLIVCWLELDGLSHLIGEEEARAILGRMDHYRWIYKQVLENGSALQRVIESHDLRIKL